jgi:hypothetical protein
VLVIDVPGSSVLAAHRGKVPVESDGHRTQLSLPRDVVEETRPLQ